MLWLKRLESAREKTNFKLFGPPICLCLNIEFYLRQPDIYSRVESV